MDQMDLVDQMDPAVRQMDQKVLLVPVDQRYLASLVVLAVQGQLMHHLEDLVDPAVLEDLEDLVNLAVLEDLQYLADLVDPAVLVDLVNLAVLEDRDR
jgi:hypothetical protein